MKRVDERDMMFSRMSYDEGSEEYNDYYKRNPEKREGDDVLRNKPSLYSDETPTYNPILAPAAVANFEFIADIRKYSVGKSAEEKIEVEPKEITDAIKKLTLHYGAADVGIAYADDKFWYSHRGRHKESYGEEVDSSLKNAIVFTVEMKHEVINTAPQISAGVETSKAYIDAAIVGMQISYYIRQLGYNARNHMDGNYLMPMIPVAEQAGLGEQGRNNLLISRKKGCFCRIGVVTTDMPLVFDKRADFNVKRFCELCSLCVNTCPAKTIPRGDDSKSWHIEQEKCYDIWTSIGNDCGVCISACPMGQGILPTGINDMSDEEILDFIAEYREKNGTRKRTMGKYFI